MTKHVIKNDPRVCDRCNLMKWPFSLFHHHSLHQIIPMAAHFIKKWLTHNTFSVSTMWPKYFQRSVLTMWNLISTINQIVGKHEKKIRYWIIFVFILFRFLIWSWLELVELTVAVGGPGLWSNLSQCSLAKHPDWPGSRWTVDSWDNISWKNIIEMTSFKM